MHILTHDSAALTDCSGELAYERETRYGRLRDRWEVLENQHRRLEALLSIALRDSQYYQRVGAEQGISLHQGLATFKRLPLLSRDIYATNLKNIRIATRRLCYRDRTSGTSGRPLEVFRDSRSVYFESLRFGDLLNYYVGGAVQLGSDRVAVLYVSHYSTSSEHIYRDPILEGSSVVKLRCDLGNLLNRANSMGFGLQVGTYVLTGTVSSLLYLATYEDARLGLPRPAAILPSGEALQPSARILLEETFDAPVFQLYTFRECGTVGFQCRRGEGLHIQSDSFVVELLDPSGRPVPDGITGELVVTDLNNYHTPLLRYTTGDFGSVQWTRCVCGLFLPILTGLSGRTPVEFVATDGRLVDTAVFAKRLERLPILWFRIAQSAEGDVRMEYCPTVEKQPDGLREFCRDLGTALKLGTPISAESVTREQALQQGKSGGFISYRMVRTVPTYS